MATLSGCNDCCAPAFSWWHFQVVDNYTYKLQCANHEVHRSHRCQPCRARCGRFRCGACHLRKWRRGVAPAAVPRSHRQCAQVLNMACLFKKAGQSPLPDLSDLHGQPIGRGRCRDACIGQGGQYTTLQGNTPAVCWRFLTARLTVRRHAVDGHFME